MLRSRWTPAQTGTQGLFRLVKQAHETYKAEVSTLQKSYKRYALDFIHSNQFHDEKDAWSKNEHQKNYYTITDLLREHEKLVCKYFNRNKLDDAEIADLLNEFYVSDLSKPDMKTGIGLNQSRRITPSSLYSTSIRLTSLCNLPMRSVYLRRNWTRTTWPPAMRRTRCGQ